MCYLTYDVWCCVMCCDKEVDNKGKSGKEDNRQDGNVKNPREVNGGLEQKRIEMKRKGEEKKKNGREKRSENKRREKRVEMIER